MKLKKLLNRGRAYRRTEYVDKWSDRPNLEKVFADAWEDANEPRVWLNYGYGILQDLFIEVRGRFGDRFATHVINKRERMIVATVIQWLGSNCGFCWLSETLEKAGYRIERVPVKKETTHAPR